MNKSRKRNLLILLVSFCVIAVGFFAWEEMNSASNDSVVDHANSGSSTDDNEKDDTTSDSSSANAAANKAMIGDYFDYQFEEIEETDNIYALLEQLGNYQIQFDDVVDGKLYFSTITFEDNSFEGKTQGLYSYDLETYEIELIKDIQNQYRVDSFTMHNGVPFYTAWKSGGYQIYLGDSIVKEAISISMPSAFQKNDGNVYFVCSESGEDDALTRYYCELQADGTLRTIYEYESSSTSDLEGVPYPVYFGYGEVNIPYFATKTKNSEDSKYTYDFYYLIDGKMNTFTSPSITSASIQPFGLDNYIILNEKYMYNIDTQEMISHSSSVLNGAGRVAGLSQNSFIFLSSNYYPYIGQIRDGTFYGQRIMELGTESYLNFQINQDSVLICEETQTYDENQNIDSRSIHLYKVTLLDTKD